MRARLDQRPPCRHVSHLQQRQGGRFPFRTMNYKIETISKGIYSLTYPEVNEHLTAQIARPDIESEKDEWTLVIYSDKEGEQKTYYKAEELKLENAIRTAVSFIQDNSDL